MTDELKELVIKLREFRDERDWGQFHSLRNLISSVSIESAELLELTQWKSDQEIENMANNREDLVKLEHEIADIFLYLILIADKIDVDLLDIAHSKIELNAKKYPAHKAKGLATKYTEL